LDTAETPWNGFLGEFFEDTRAQIHYVPDAVHAMTFLGKIFPDIAFVNPSLFSMALGQKLKVFRQTAPQMRIFALGHPDPKIKRDFPFDDYFHQISSFPEFQKKLVKHLPVLENIRLLVVDDEPEVGSMLRDFLKDRTHPSYEVEYAADGQKGLDAVARFRPDIILLDIKMPVMDGREVYRELKQQGLEIPVIIFFDAVSGEEIVEIRRIGQPAVLEKGSRQSALMEMPDLIRKMIYFG
jgi:CheY-like chemotaxis protein